MVENKTSSQNIATDDPPAKKPWWTVALEWLPYPVAIAVGFLAFDVEVRKGIYANIAKKKYFQQLRDKRDTNYISVLNRGSVDGKSISPELHEFQEIYRSEISDHFKNKFGMKGMRDY